MRIGTNQFRGELPHLAPEALPDQGAQEATNCRLESGNLESYRQFAQTKVLANTGTVQTIFLAQHPTTTASEWLSFNEQVDIARNVVEDDPDGLLLLTCPELFDTPVYTTYAAATTGAEPFPVAGSLLPLGVPGPSDIPVLVIGVDTTPTTFTIDVLDEGDVLSSEWTVSAPAGGGGTFTFVNQDASAGNPGSCYRLQYDEVHSNSQGPYAFRDFGIASAAAITVSTDFQFAEDDDVQRRAGLSIACTVAGSGIAAHVYSGNTLRIAIQSEWSGWFGAATVSAVACSLGHGVWYRLQVDVVVKPDGAQDVTATVFQGATLIATVHGVAVAEIGNYVGISAVSEADANPRYATRFDNIHVQASGSTGITPNLTATNYVYTFVNNRGWESVPSLPTEDILRPDGVSVTVTTSTTAPTGYSAVTLKRIYRLVSALTGDLFLLVAEIPLAQADYVDTLTDNQVGPDVLESQEFDLPPATLEGIQPLPNGGYSGFFGKQLCISAAGWPHAWPVRQRHSCEFDIVATGKLGNTIVVGTTGRVYTCTGTEPSNYVMSEPGEAQSCVSKPSMVYLDGQGVAFASPDGYQLCSGSAGNLRNLTENVFTKRQWREKNPSSIIGAVHDGVLHWYWETEEPVTETVLFLFHMTPGASGEGDAIEFGAGATSAVDQTGATWTADSTNWLLPVADPSPKFGAHSLGSTAPVTWSRDFPQSNPFVEDDFYTLSSAALQIDGFVYLTTDEPSAAFEITVGVETYPFNTVVFLRIFAVGYALIGFDSPGEESHIDASDIIPQNEWVHVRLLLTENNLRLYVNGVIALTVQTSSLVPLEEMNHINIFQPVFGLPGVYLDEARAVLSNETSTANFTPPVAPWPNP